MALECSVSELTPETRRLVRAHAVAVAQRLQLVESTGLRARFERLTAAERIEPAALLKRLAEPAFDAAPPPAGPAEVGRALEAAMVERTIA